MLLLNAILFTFTGECHLLRLALARRPELFVLVLVGQYLWCEFLFMLAARLSAPPPADPPRVAPYAYIPDRRPGEPGYVGPTRRTGDQ